MFKLGQILHDIGTKIVLVVFGAIILYLTVLSVFGTCVEAIRVYDDGRALNYVYFLPDHPLKHLAVFIVFIVVLLLIYSIQKRISLHKNTYFYVGIIFIVFFAAALIFILLTRYEIGSDSGKVMGVAYDFMNGDFHQFEPGTYMYKYPYQCVLMLYMCAFIMIFGESAGVMMQIANIVILIVSYYYIAKIAELLWNRKKTAIAVVLTMAVSLPMLFYTTFVYGNYIGFMFSVMAIYQELMLFKDEKTYRIFLSAGFITLAIIFKNNFLIMIIAMLLVGAVEFMRDKRIVLMVKFVGIVLASFIIGNQLVSVVMGAALGFDLPKGLPKTTWIVMGLEEAVVSPGSYNGRSGEIYEENNWDYDAANKAAKEEIALMLGRYADDWRRGLDFFGRKQASQWNEPSFQCFSILWGREGSYQVPAWLQSFIKGRGSVILLELFDLSQTLVLAGVCLYLFLCNKENSLQELIFAVIFVGGFLFHTFWEAKSQYTMLYFFLLIPYMVRGYERLLYKLTELMRQFKGKGINVERQLLIKRTLVAICVIIVIIPAANRLSRMKTVRYIFAPFSDEELVMQYEQKIEEITSGEAYFYGTP